MKAAFFVDQGSPLLVEEVTPRPPGPRDVVVKLGAAGVCHTDLTIASGGLPCPPAIIGHEGAGVVDWVGADAGGFRVGDRVVGLTIARCGRCSQCRRGTPFLCAEAALHGPARAQRDDGTDLVTTNGLGTFAETMTVDTAGVIRVTSELPDEHLALIGCAFATGMGAVFNTASVEPGSDVLIVGCGGVGQAIVQASRVAGAANIVAVDPILAKRQLAVESGATAAVIPSEGTLEEIVANLRLDGVDYVFDTVGRPETLYESYAALRRGGMVVAIGVGDLRSEIHLPGRLVIDAKRVIGCVFGNTNVDRDIPRIIDLAQRGLLNIDAMITNKISLDDVGSAMQALESGDTLRTVITFG